MIDYNLIEEYKYFKESLDETYCILKSFINLCDTVFMKTQKLNEYELRKEIENNLFYLEQTMIVLDNIFQELQNISFCNDTKFLTKNTDVRQININEDIYVSPDYNLKHIWKD